MIGEMGAVAKSVTVIAAAFAALWGGVTAMDSRYELQEVHEPEHQLIQTGMDNFSYTVLKKEIREIRQSLQSATDPNYRQSLENDLYDAIDRLCRIAPEDRECK